MSDEKSGFIRNLFSPTDKRSSNLAAENEQLRAQLHNVGLELQASRAAVDRLTSIFASHIEMAEANANRSDPVALESRQAMGVLQRNWLLREKASFKKAWLDFQAYAARQNIPNRAIILCGPAKSGNTLLRFVFHNLVNRTLNGATETLTYHQLNEMQRNIGFPHVFRDDGNFRAPHEFNYSEFPLMFHAHHPWESFWPGIGNTLFVVRNPLDTLVSYWYHNVENEIGKRGTISVEDYADTIIDHWIGVFLASFPNADAVLRYECLMRRPHSVIPKAFRVLNIPFKDSNLADAIEMSRFENVQKMEDKSGQHHGHMIFNPNFHLGPTPDWNPDARFARSGEVGQWQAHFSNKKAAAL